MWIAEGKLRAAGLGLASVGAHGPCVPADPALSPPNAPAGIGMPRDRACGPASEPTIIYYIGHAESEEEEEEREKEKECSASRVSSTAALLHPTPGAADSVPARPRPLDPGQAARSGPGR